MTEEMKEEERQKKKINISHSLSKLSNITQHIGGSGGIRQPTPPSSSMQSKLRHSLPTYVIRSHQMLVSE